MITYSLSAYVTVFSTAYGTAGTLETELLAPEPLDFILDYGGVIGGGRIPFQNKPGIGGALAGGAAFFYPIWFGSGGIIGGGAALRPPEWGYYSGTPFGGGVSGGSAIIFKGRYVDFFGGAIGGGAAYRPPEWGYRQGDVSLKGAVSGSIPMVRFSIITDGERFFLSDELANNWLRATTTTGFVRTTL